MQIHKQNPTARLDNVQSYPTRSQGWGGMGWGSHCTLYKSFFDG